MTRTVISPAVTALLLVLPACGALEDFGVLTVREPLLPAVSVDQRADIGPLVEFGCDDGLLAAFWEGEPPPYHIEAVPGGCALSFEKHAVPVIDAGAATAAAEYVQGGVVSAAAVEVQAVSLVDETGAEVPFAELIQTFEIRLGETVLVDERGVMALWNGPIRVDLPPEVLQETARSVAQGLPLELDFATRVVIDEAAFDRVPAQLRLQARLQPVLEVNLLQLAQAGLAQ